MARFPVGQVGPAVDGVTTVGIAEARTEMTEEEADHDQDPKGVDDRTAEKEVAKDHALTAEDVGDRGVEKTHEIQDEDESTEKRKSKVAADLENVAV